MSKFLKMPPNNLSLYPLRRFVGRHEELETLTSWLDYAPAIAITGPSGIGKSSMVCALAISLHERFDEGIIHVSAGGVDEFHFYDIIRSIEDVLKTGITSRPPDEWALLSLQQLYGRRRLLILDEITQASELACHHIAELIRKIGPGGEGRFIFLGRRIPAEIAAMIKPRIFELRGLKNDEIANWIKISPATRLLKQEQAPLLGELTEGMPLALRLLAPLYGSPDWEEVTAKLAQLPKDKSPERLMLIMEAATTAVERKNKKAAHLLIRLSSAMGGANLESILNHYWHDLGPNYEIPEALALLDNMCLITGSDEDRYYLHPAIRRFLVRNKFDRLPGDVIVKLQHRHVDYYLTNAQQYERNQPVEWKPLELEWGNISHSMAWLIQRMHDLTGREVIELVEMIDGLPPLKEDAEQDLRLLCAYALALRTYCVNRQPPDGLSWLAGGVVAARYLGDMHALALIGARLAQVAYKQKRFDLSIAWCKRSISAFRLMSDKARQSRVLEDLAMVYKATKRYEEAAHALEDAMFIYKDQNLMDALAGSKMQIGSIRFAAKRYDIARQAYLEAFKLYEAQGNLAGQASAINSLGLLSDAQNQFRQAINHYEISLNMYTELKDQDSQGIVFNNLGAAWYELGEPEKALQYYEKDLAISENRGDWIAVAANLHNMGHVALELNSLDAALHYFSRSLELYREFGLAEYAKEEESLIKITAERRA